MKRTILVNIFLLLITINVQAQQEEKAVLIGEYSLKLNSSVLGSLLKPLDAIKIDLPKNTVLDFSDNQFEIVSDVYDHTENLYCNMYKVLDNGIITSNKMWPLSMPGIIDYKVSIEGCKTEEERIYRQGLLAKYSPSMLLFSGIHINVSLEKEHYCTSECYFKIMKKIYTYGPLLMQFYAFTPFVTCGKGLKQFGDNQGLDNSISLRNTSEYGYYNEDKLNLDYTNTIEFNKSIEKAISDGKIQNRKELYQKVRLKENKDGDPYLELRFIDLNPYNRLGINLEELKLVKMFIKLMEVIDNDNFEYWHFQCRSNQYYWN